MDIESPTDAPGVFHAGPCSLPNVEPSLTPNRGLFGGETGGRYHTILMDPPWPIKWQHSDTLGMKQLQYQTLPISEIMQLPIDSLAHQHCLLLMWVTNEFLPEGLGIVRHWKFQYEKLYTWCKNNGVGGRPRNATEHFIIATKGTPPRQFDRHESALLNWIELPRGRHSEKPREFYPIVESFTLGPRIELFARRRQPGWAVWGNEIPNDVELVPENDPSSATGMSRPRASTNTTNVNGSSPFAGAHG